jgi:HAD superfamily hydrolase (TIGR01509 family)
MDGVIVDTNPYHKIALKQFCEKYGFSFSEDEMRREIFGRTNKIWLKKLFGEDAPETELMNYEEEKESLFRSIYAPHIKPVQGLVNFLNRLEKHQIQTAIASSAPKKNVEFVIRKTGILKYFNIIVDGDSVINSKPHPEIYLKTAAALKLPTSKCIVIEDSLSGVEAGKRAGCKVIGITTTHTINELKETQFTIKDFNDLSTKKLSSLFEDQ